MSAPNIDIQVEPTESGKAVYLPLAAMTAGGTTMVKIVLRLRLENKGGSAVKVNGITFSFPGSSYAAKTMQGVNMDGSLDLDAGEAAFWSNGRVNLDPDDDNVDNLINNSVYLTGAAPAASEGRSEVQGFLRPGDGHARAGCAQEPGARGRLALPVCGGRAPHRRIL